MASGDGMTALSLLLGWPLGDEAKSNRPFAMRGARRRFDAEGHAQHYLGDGHLVTFAPTGAGKGVRVIIPNLLHYDGPVITIDPKGENFAVTARYRAKVLKQRIFLLDPFEVVPQSVIDNLDIHRAALNPLDLISVKGEMGSQLQMMAALLTPDPPGGESKDDFWTQGARLLVAGALGAAVTDGEVNNRPPSFQKFMDLLTSDDVVYNLAVVHDTIGSKLDKVASKGISNFLGRADKERSGVLSTALSHLTPFTSSQVNRYLDSSTIKPTMLLNDDDYTIYIVIPPSKLLSHALLLQLWIATMLNAVMERGEKPLKRTLFLLDECAQLGKLHALSKAVTLLRGYGLQVWMFFQDLAQLESNYGSDATTIVNNCAVFQAFGLTRNFAAKPISEYIGRYEPEDLVQLDKTQQILSLATEPARISRLLNYLGDELFAGRWDPNPLFQKHHKIDHPSEGFPANALRVQF